MEKDNDQIWNGSFLFVCWTYFFILLAFISLRVISGFGWLHNIDIRWVEIGFSFLSQVIIMAAMPIIAMFLYKRRKERNQDISLVAEKPKVNLFTSFGFDKPSWKVIGMAFLLGILIYFFNIFVASFFNGILSMFGFRMPTGMGSMPFTGIWGLFISLTLIAVLPGICEEVSHRGMLLKSFESRMGVMRAILFSSILFGFMHLNIIQVFYAAILGYIIALATVATKSLWVGIIMHFMNNALGTYFSIAHNYGWVGGNLLHHMMDIFATAGGIVLYIAFIIFLVWSIFKIIHHLASEKYNNNKTGYLAEIIKRNPEMLNKQNGGIYTFDEFTQKIDFNVKRSTMWAQTKFFLDPTIILPKKPMNLTRHEKVIFYGVLFMGGVITIFTMVWGFL